ncbi:MAG: hypothetical protein ACFFBZ_12610 [Promethearchaeota archaeon]
MQIQSALSYFDRKMGPSVFYSYPENKLKEESALVIANLMDQIISEGFFTHSFNSSYTMNYYFEIDSKWARGNKEFLMISVIFNQPPLLKTEKAIFNLCIEFSEWLKTKKEIFTAFYERTSFYNQNSEKEIKYNIDLVKSWIREFNSAILDEIEGSLEEENIISLLERNDVIQTLELLGTKPVPIIELKVWYNEKFPHTNFYKILTTLFRNHLVFIPKIGGRRKPPFKIQIKKEIKTIVGLISLKNRLIKKYIQNNQIKDNNVLERNTKEFHKFLEKVFSEKQVI